MCSLCCLGSFWTNDYRRNEQIRHLCRSDENASLMFSLLLVYNKVFLLLLLLLSACTDSPYYLHLLCVKIRNGCSVGAVRWSVDMVLGRQLGTGSLSYSDCTR